MTEPARQLTYQFSINYSQYVDAQGNLTQPLPAFALELTNLVHLYRTMTLLRVFDAKAVALQRTGKLGTYPSSLGQEAVMIGMGSALQPEDVFCPSYREHGTQLLRGVMMSEVLAYWGGSERGNHYNAANAKEDFPNCVPIGSQCLHAAGVATAMKLRKQKRAALVAIGDGGTSQGDFYEAMNVAGIWQLPLVIVINNNQWAISISRQSQTAAKTLAQKAIAGGIPGEQVDGNDIIAVRHSLENALNKARNGGGPSVIEAITYRLSDHTTADDASRYRSKDELTSAWNNEPIKRLRNYLISQDAWSDDAEVQLATECAQQVEQAVQAYLQLPPEPTENIFNFHYAVLPENLLAQRAAFLDIHKG